MDVYFKIYNIIFNNKQLKRKKKRVGLIYSPNMCLSIGNACGNSSSTLMKNVLVNSLPLGVERNTSTSQDSLGLSELIIVTSPVNSSIV